MAFEGSCTILPEGSRDQIELRKRGHIALPMPEYGMQMWIRPDAIRAAEGSMVAIVMEVSARIVPFEQARSATWRKDWKGVTVTKLGVRSRK